MKRRDLRKESTLPEPNKFLWRNPPQQNECLKTADDHKQIAGKQVTLKLKHQWQNKTQNSTNARELKTLMIAQVFAPEQGGRRTFTRRPYTNCFRQQPRHTLISQLYMTIITCFIHDLIIYKIYAFIIDYLNGFACGISVFQEKFQKNKKPQY
jgi:hypothetical protein